MNIDFILPFVQGKDLHSLFLNKNLIKMHPLPGEFRDDGPFFVVVVVLKMYRYFIERRWREEGIYYKSSVLGT